MRGAFGYLKRKIGPWTTLFYPEVGEPFYDPVKRAIGVGDGTIDGVMMLTEDQPQQVTNKTIDAKRNTIQNLPAVGCLVVTVVDLQPDPTFLACDGAALLRTAFPELFNVIKTTFGQGDGVSTFNLPPPTVMGTLGPTCKVWIKARP